MQNALQTQITSFYYNRFLQFLLQALQYIYFKHSFTTIVFYNFYCKHYNTFISSILLLQYNTTILLPAFFSAHLFIFDSVNEHVVDVNCLNLFSHFTFTAGLVICIHNDFLPFRKFISFVHTIVLFHCYL